MLRKDVSCKIVQGILEYAETLNIAPETVCAGLPYPLDYLRNKHMYIEWDAYCKMVANLRLIWSDDEFFRMGFEITKTVPFRTIVSVARLLYTGPEIYFWWTRGANSPGRQMFGCVTTATEQIGKDHVLLTVALFPGYQYCHEFFVTTKGSMTAATVVMGLGPARVTMREIDRGAAYDIICPPGGGALSWLRRAAIWPSAVRTAARELQDANEALHERYAQLEEAQAKIQRQATQLQTALSITELIRADLDLDKTMRAVARSLVTEAHFAAARVIVALKTGAESVNRLAREGTPSPDQRVLTKGLEARGQYLGELTVWLDGGMELREAQELLDHVSPSVAMEINDALYFTLVTEYRNREKVIQQEFSRRQIESLEMERQRLASELHDGLGQDLLVASNEIQRMLQERPNVHEDLEQVASLLQGSIEGVRDIASNLRPHHLDRLGFKVAVDAMTEKITRTAGLSIDTVVDNLDSLLPKETQLHLYRIIQEALTNVVRHAAARHVRIEVHKNAETVDVTVTDDGRGFQSDEGRERGSLRPSTEGLHGFGLSSMSERARIIGGRVVVTSSPGSGTTVQVTIPCT